MQRVREPAVAGMFYPDRPDVLRSEIRGFLDDVKLEPGSPVPKALVLPHAGYVYSGPVAATGYRRVLAARDIIRRVVLLGPSHRVPFTGLAAPTSEVFTTPLGAIPVDREAIAAIEHFPQVQLLDQAHAVEHSLEVHLPFLQAVLEHFVLIPLVVGDATSAQVGEVLDELWGGEETLVVISSDLSHYHDYDTARQIDAQTSQAIEARRPDIGPEQACGCRPLNGLLHLARARGLAVTILDLRNSGDTAGSTDRVVGYGAYALL